MMPRTLYAKLALALTLVLMGVGLFYVLLSSWLGKHYQQEFLQHLNRDLAAKLVAERRLVRDGVLDRQALKETFHHYMTVNPSIEIYLLDQQGAILAYSADPGKVKRDWVDVRPLQAFIGGEALPVLGDDPRDPMGRKIFSATRLPSVHGAVGYLYVVLRGEEYARMERQFLNNLLLKLSGSAVIVSLLLGLLLGLVLFRWLTHRLELLGRQMHRFSDADFSQPFPYPEDTCRDDEIECLGRHYNSMAERIRHQIEDLKRQDVLRRELVTNVSHDLRTPLAALQGYIETLYLKSSAFDDATRSEYLKTALQHSRRLTRLVEELFELAKLDAHETEIRSEPFALAELVQDVIQKFRLQAEQRDIRLHMDGSRYLPFVDGDIALIERVLENLISNALRHTAEGGEVSVGLEQRQGRVVIQVSDNGEGINEQDLPHVFERLYRGGDPQRSGIHAGLGLAIARQIVQLHHSEMTVSSRPGEGARFSFDLPVRLLA